MAEELIASFQVDHTKIGPGIFVSRRDNVQGGFITTFDVRMKRPNVEPAIHANAMHTIEHIVATYLRNSSFKDHVVYWGPMGCLTGFYFIILYLSRSKYPHLFMRWGYYGCVLINMQLGRISSVAAACPRSAQ